MVVLTYHVIGQEGFGVKPLTTFIALKLVTVTAFLNTGAVSEDKADGLKLGDWEGEEGAVESESGIVGSAEAAVT